MSLPKLEVDRHLLGVALVNLVVNACEAMAGAAGSCLELSIEVGPAPELTRTVRVDREEVAAARIASQWPSASFAQRAEGERRPEGGFAQRAEGERRPEGGLAKAIGKFRAAKPEGGEGHRACENCGSQ